MYMLLFSAFLLCVSCQPITNCRGNVAILDHVDSFVIGKTTMSEVLSQCGTPSINKNNFTWIYICGRSEQTAFQDLSIADKTVIKLVFDKKKILKDIQRSYPHDDVLINDEVTPLISEHQASEFVKQKYEI